MLDPSYNYGYDNSCILILCIHISSMLKLGTKFFELFLSTLKVRVLGHKYIPTEQGNHTGWGRLFPQETTTNTDRDRNSPWTQQISGNVEPWGPNAETNSTIHQKMVEALTHLMPLKKPSLCHYFHAEHKRGKTCMLPASKRELCPQTAALCSQVSSFGFLALPIFLLK